MSDANSTPSSSQVSITESLPEQKRWLDQLDDAAAMAIMAEDQRHAAAAVEAALDAITQAAGAVYEKLIAHPDSKIFYAGAGTSIRIGVQDGVELSPTFDWPEDRTGFIIAGGNDALMRSIENAEDNADAARSAVASNVTSKDVVIGIAASGSTAFTCSAVAAAGHLGALTIGIANNPDAPLTALADHGITLLTGAESVAGSTRMKAGTAQKICLNLISTLVMVKMGRVQHGVMSAMRPANAKLRDRQQRINAFLKR